MFGGTGSDAFTLGAGAGAMLVDGGDGTDTVTGPSLVARWNITGTGAGTV